MNTRAQTTFGYIGHIGKALAFEFDHVHEGSHIVAFLRGPKKIIQALNSSARSGNLRSGNLLADGTVTIDFYTYRMGLLQAIPHGDLPGGLSEFGASGIKPEFYYSKRHCTKETNPLVNREDGKRVLIIDAVYNELMGVPASSFLFTGYRLAVTRDASEWGALFCGDGKWYSIMDRVTPCDQLIRI